VLLVVPALRETTIIGATLEHLAALDYPIERLVIVVAAARECVRPGETTTAQAARAWAACHGGGRVLVAEFPGDRTERAVQINYAVDHALAGPAADAEILGFYDVDSRPHPATLHWVAWHHVRGIRCQQQVLHYLDAANDLAARNAPPLCVANAVYQGSWSLTKEWPNLLRYRHQWSTVGGPYRRSLYLNGHGQFLSRALFEEIGGAPVEVVTDGIQLGYRLSLLGEPIASIPLFCSDDVPATVSGLHQQHRRWFAGNIRFADACDWARAHGRAVPATAVVDNLLLNASWLLRLPLTVVAGLIVCLVADGPLRAAMVGSLLASVAVYGYVLPILATRVPGVALRLRLRDWLLLPVAAGFKSVGPLLFLVQTSRIGRGAAERTLQKVER
jgi:cellulose synthase/poly-beta-1,6-N-acetylglucosamine synthase-like glycosyltransferase